jgi:alpha-tubulin suppressor-like RCC1 family protein
MVPCSFVPLAPSRHAPCSALTPCPAPIATMIHFVILSIILSSVYGQQLASSGYGGCVLAATLSFKNTSSIRCWGTFLFPGNSQVNPNPPSTVDVNGQSIVHVAMTQNVACVLSEVGQIQCWGDATNGIYNVPSTLLKQITLGNWYCGIRLDNQQITCWGSNANPALIPAGNYTFLSANGYQTCALSVQQTIVCFGTGPVIIPVQYNQQIIQMAAGVTHVCVIYSDQSIRCFGTNNLGESNPPSSNLWLQLGAGDRVTCGIRLDQTILCFGNNNVGQSSPPSGTFLQLSMSLSSGCAIRNNPYQTIVCWGSNVYGEQNPPAIEVISIHIGFAHACLLPYDQTLLCYGDNSLGQLNVPYSDPTASVAVGNQFTCSVQLSTQKAYCYGDNSANQITNLPAAERFSGVYSSSDALTVCGVRSSDQTIVCWGSCTSNRCNPPAWLQTNASIATGVSASCAISMIDSSAVCWGSGLMAVAPTQTYFLQVSCGNQHCCGLTTSVNGTIVCWGSNSLGQLNVPINLGPFVYVSAGYNFNCAIRFIDRSIVCWGNPSNLANQPSVIGNAFLSVWAGASVACSIQLGNQTSSCWGDNTYNLLNLPRVSASNLALAPLRYFKIGITKTECFNGRYSNQRGSISYGCSGLCDPGYYGNSSDVTISHCTSICPSGSYCLSGSVQPISCPAGRFGAVMGLTDSTCSGPCPSGFYCKLGTADATDTPCPPGLYGSTVGLSNQNCSGSCEAGYFCPTASFSSQSVPCGNVGVYCPSGSSTPLPVTPGYYSIGPTAATRTDQSPCPAGYYCSGGLKFECGNVGFYCPALSQVPITVTPGYYTTGGNISSTIYPCPAGYYCVNGQPSKCGNANVYCPATSSQPVLVSIGYFSTGGINQEMAVSQAPCIAGQYCIAGQQYNCLKGTFSNQNQQIQCTLCSPGYYQDLNQATECKACGFSSYQSLAGQSFCNTCPTASFTTTDHDITCTACRPGQSTNKTQIPFTCQDCLPGYFADNVTCSPCASGTFTATGASESCTRCPDGTFAAFSGQTVCNTCTNIEGVTCKDGDINNNENVWVQIQSNGDIVAIDCPTGYCKSQFQCANNRKPFSENVLCGQCLDGYTEWNGECVYCEKANGGFIFLIICLSWFYVLFTHYISNTANHRSGATTTFFYFVQICYMETGAVSNWLSWISIFNFAPHNVGGATCILPLTLYESFAINLFIPALFFGQLFLTLVTHYSLVRWLPLLYNQLNWRQKCCTPMENMIHADHPKTILFPWKNYGRTTLVLFLWSYTQISSTVIQFFQCTSVPNTSYYIVANNPGIDCNSTTYKQWQIMAIFILIVVVILIPVGIMVKLWKFRFAMKTFRQKRDRHANEIEFIQLWGVLFEPYHGRFWFWEIIVILGRRISMVTLNTVMSAAPLYKQLVFTWFHAFTGIIQLKWKPFHARFDNQLEQIFIFILLLLSTVLIVAKAPFTIGIQVLIVFMFPLPGLILLVAIFSKRFQDFYDQHFPPPKVGDLVLSPSSRTLDTTAEQNNNITTVELTHPSM